MLFYFTTELTQLPLSMVHAAGFSRRKVGLSITSLQPWMRCGNIYYYIFQKVHKSFNRLIYNITTFEKSNFLPYGEPLGAILPRGGFTVDFEHMVLIFFWKYIKFAIDWFIIWLYLGTLIFHTMWSPYRGLELCTAVLWLSPLLFLIVLV